LIFQRLEIASDLMKPRKTFLLPSCLLLAALLAAPLALFGQSAPLAYQGRLTAQGAPANGAYEMQFKLFNTPEVGTGVQQGTTISNPSVNAASGLFTVTLDFGVAVFDGSPRYLEISVRPAGTTALLSILAPRQAITPVPYAIHTLSAAPASGVRADAAGNVAIGTTNFPASIRLNVEGLTRFAPGGSGGFFQIGTPNGETGVSIIGTNRLDLRFNQDTATLAAGGNSGPPAGWNGITLNTNGNVGVGMGLLPPSDWKLEINGRTRITPVGGAGGAIHFHTPNSETGMSIVGQNGLEANRADLRFDNSVLKLVAGPGIGPPGNLSGLSVTTAGSVGIGTTSPRGALHVASGGVAVTGFSSTYIGAGRGLFLESGELGGSLFAYDYTAGVPRNLILNLFGGNVGVGAGEPIARLHAREQAPNKPAIHAEGHASQERAAGGMAKAMVYIKGSTIARCYSGVGTTLFPPRLTQGNCGIELVDRSGDSFRDIYIINFGFRVDDRFVAVTTDWTGTHHTVANVIYNPRGNPNEISVLAGNADGDQLDETIDITVVVY